MAYSGAGPTITNVNSGNSPYNIIGSETFIAVDTTGGPISIVYPAFIMTAQSMTIKDSKGNAHTNNITISANSGNFDGSSTYVINQNYQSCSLIYDGTNYQIQ